MISIITSTRDSFKHKRASLELMLRSLSMQTIASNCELVVVDNASKDRTAEYLEQFHKTAPFSNMTIIHNDIDVSNRSKSRNIACEQARGKFLLFIDDDVVLPETTTLQKVRKFAHEASFATGAARYWTKIGWERQILGQMMEQGDLPRESEHYFLPTGIKRETGYRDLFEYSFLANFGIVDRESFINAGGFDEKTFNGWGREDVDLMLRLYLKDTKFRLMFDDIWVLHLNHPLSRRDAMQRNGSFRKYKKRESDLGVVFKVNHLYGVFEDDGTAILEPLAHEASSRAEP